MINLIAAVSENNVIGNNNQLIWHISRDLKRFKELTTNHPIIMGRKTFESLGKPLPNRVHFVISRQEKESENGVFWVNSLDEAIQLAMTFDTEIYIIGGGEIYRQALPIADKLEITEVHKSYQGDTFFPVIHPEEWKEIQRIDYKETEEHPAFSFVTYARNSN